VGPTVSELTPPSSLYLIGHPVRWRLLALLAQSDHTVRELTGLTGNPQNLVSYHLGKLRNARLVAARRSSADHRDTFYAVDLTRLGGLLATAGETMHPGLRMAAPDPANPQPRRSSARVLFLCTGNSARSQMAEALTRNHSGGLIEAHSAGSNPKTLHSNAVRVLRDDYGIDISAYRSKHLDEFIAHRFDRVITLCDRVREVCPKFPGDADPVHWSVPDPAVGHASGDDSTSYPAFQQTAAELATRIGFLLAALGAPTSTRSPHQQEET
jgi:ArsR family transcriptional regulator, arsenate/arsenite/antimonite-responsive transcriptional repressor / arsenate reductase (thioredoxin)